MSLITKQSLSVAEVAELIGAELRGDGNTVLDGICSLEQAKAGHLTFISRTLKKETIQTLKEAGIGAAIASKEHVQELAQSTEVPFALILTEEPYASILKLVESFYQVRKPPEGINPQAFVDPSAQIGERVSIQAFCSVGADVVLEDDVVLYPNVTIYPGVRVGARSVIHSGACIREDCVLGADSVVQNGSVIGATGFGYVPHPKLGLVPAPHIGKVVLGDRVDLGANTCVDRGTLGDTRIGAGTKLDNLVQVGHNVQIGSNSIVCGQVGLSGSCKVGDRVTLAGGVGIADHIEVADDCRFGARSGVTHHIREKGDYAGYPAIPGIRWKRQMKSLEQLPKLVRELRSFQKHSQKPQNERE